MSDLPPIKPWSVLAYGFLVFGLLILPLSIYSLASETYRFVTYGEPKTAEVLSLERRSSSRGGSSYLYRVTIDEDTRDLRFKTRLRVGGRVSVLTLADDPDAVVLGTADSSWFQIYSSLLGSQFMGVLTLLVGAFMAVMTPSLLRTLIKGRSAFIRGQKIDE